MTKVLLALGWLRDLVIVFLVIAGWHLRHESPAVGLSVIAAAAVIFAERFLWSWHLCALRDAPPSSEAAGSESGADAD
ncbi:MAG TPA: hypothetical protein VJP87_01805 [Candidatus Acidoferrales bacterium]|nr:hypothetical protein [Candidatus Acidoferrales bacterium]